jgi:hypothetical protein
LRVFYYCGNSTNMAIDIASIEILIAVIDYGNTILAKDSINYIYSLLVYYNDNKRNKLFQKENTIMKNKLFTYLMVGMIAVTGISIIAPSMTVHAITQDELSAYGKYLNSLIAQGYSKEDIRAYLHANGDGSIATAMVILPEAVANGSLKKAGQAAPAQTEDKGAVEKKEDQTPVPVHEHQYSANLTTNPTCTEEGVMTYTCSCGDSYTEPYPKLEHQYEKEITREPSCAEEGETTYTCTLCGDTYTEPIAKVEHTPGAAQVTKEATCTDEGEKTVRCTVCGEEISTETTPVKEHQAGESKVTVEPTLFKEGVSETYCKDCGALMTSEVVPAKLNSTQQTIASVVTGVAIALVLYLGISRAVASWKRHKATKG